MLYLFMYTKNLLTRNIANDIIFIIRMKGEGFMKSAIRTMYSGLMCMRFFAMCMFSYADFSKKAFC